MDQLQERNLGFRKIIPAVSSLTLVWCCRLWCVFLILFRRMRKQWMVAWCPMPKEKIQIPVNRRKAPNGRGPGSRVNLWWNAVLWSGSLPAPRNKGQVDARVKTHTHRRHLISCPAEYMNFKAPSLHQLCVCSFSSLSLYQQSVFKLHIVKHCYDEACAESSHLNYWHCPFVRASWQ